MNKFRIGDKFFGKEHVANILNCKPVYNNDNKFIGYTYYCMLSKGGTEVIGFKEISGTELENFYKRSNRR